MRPKTTAGARLGIVNPTTLVGNELKLILNQRGTPYAKMELIDTSGAEEATITDIGDEAAFVIPAREDEFEDLDIVFFCGAGGSSREWIERADEFGFLAIDLTQPSAFAGEATAVVAGVNGHRMREEDRILLSPHPIANTLSLLLAPISKSHPVRLCAASVIQPASEFDQAGVDELYQQTISALNLQSIPKEIFDRQLAFNLYPLPSAAATEHYVATQVKSIVGAPLSMALSITQGTIFHGHTFAMFIESEGRPSPKEIGELFRGNPSVSIADDGETTTLDAAGRDEVIVGRISEDREMHGGFWLWAVADNLRRASALNAVLIAEEIMSRFGEPAN